MRSRTAILVLSEDRDTLLVPLSPLYPMPNSNARASLHTPSTSVDLKPGTTTEPESASKTNESAEAGETENKLREAWMSLGGRLIRLHLPIGRGRSADPDSRVGGDETYGLIEETKWAGARRAVRDKYCNKKWSQFDQLVGVIPPGGSLGLDDKVFSFALTSRSSGVPQPPPPTEQFSPEYGILRFEHGATTYEYTDLRVNPRCLVESQMFQVRSTLERLSDRGMGVGSLVLVSDGIPDFNTLFIAQSILPIAVTSHTLSTPPTPPQSPRTTNLPISPVAQSLEGHSPTSLAASSTSPTSPVASHSSASPTSPSHSPPRPLSITSILSVFSANPSSGTATQATSVLPTPPVSAGPRPHGSFAGKLESALRLSATKAELSIETSNTTRTNDPTTLPMESTTGQELSHGVKEANKDYDHIHPHLFGILGSLALPGTAGFYLPLDDGRLGTGSSWEKATYETIYPEWKRLKLIVDSRTYLPPYPQPSSPLLYLRQTPRPSPLGMDVIYGNQ